MKNTENFENDIVLAPEDELLEKATELAGTTKDKERFTFYLEYDVNKKEQLLSIIAASGAIITIDNEKKHIMTVSMNMPQLKLINSLDCVKRVKSDEGINPFTKKEFFDKKAKNDRADKTQTVAEDNSAAEKTEGRNHNNA